MNKKNLSERDICTKFITPALVAAGWNVSTQVREEVALTDGRILVRGKKHKRGPRKFADYVLYYRPNIPIAIIEAKDNRHTVGDGMQQALQYSDMHGVLPFVFSSNGDAFLFHDRTVESGEIETKVALDSFPMEKLLEVHFRTHNYGLDVDQFRLLMKLTPYKSRGRVSFSEGNGCLTLHNTKIDLQELR